MSTSDTKIVQAKVHPGIGVCRVGDSATEFYLSPETDARPNRPGSFYRDATGALKREAQRFRIYGYNAAGEVVRELTADEADITWTVHLANQKADWFQFITAMDIPETADLILSRRNPEETDRSKLIIDPGPRSITGASVKGGDNHAFNTGKFYDTVVPLGELQTDDKGRLIVLGGHGVSASPSGKGLENPGDPNWFNNSNDWYDDTSDGSVDAQVTLDGQNIPVTGGWVIVAPPNYAPDTVGWRTMYDLMTDTAIDGGMLPTPSSTDFVRDIYPILTRLSGLEWVNKGFQAMFGFGMPMDFRDPDLLAKLSKAPQPDPSDPSAMLDPYAELRQTILNTFRPPSMDVNDPRIWPWIYGDAFDGQLFDPSPRIMLHVPQVQFDHLTRWAKGTFTGGDAVPTEPASLDSLPLSQQPDMLDKAAVFFCLADAFHPGCELTWPMRHASLYSAPYRIKAAGPNDPAPTMGTTMNQTQALAADGPLHQQAPGDLTRWMGLPWQGDTAFCRAGYDPTYDEFIPTFWPARVPNSVLAMEDYETAINTANSREVRLAAYNRRLSWNRFMDEAKKSGGTAGVMERMVSTFGQQGLVAPMPGRLDDPELPPVMYVEHVPAAAVMKTSSVAAIRSLGARLEETEATPTAAQPQSNFAGFSAEEMSQIRGMRSRKGTTS